LRTIFMCTGRCISQRLRQKASFKCEVYNVPCSSAAIKMDVCSSDLITIGVAALWDTRKERQPGLADVLGSALVRADVEQLQ